MNNEVMVKCPICLEKIDSSKLNPIDEWQDPWTDVKCIFCKNSFQVAVEIEPLISSDFDRTTFFDHFDLDKFPDGIVKEDFKKALWCIAENEQELLQKGFKDEKTKQSFEFAIIHHQRVKRSLMPKESKKVP